MKSQYLCKGPVIYNMLYQHTPLSKLFYLGLFFSISIAAVMPEKYEDFHEDFGYDENNERFYSYEYRRFEDRRFEDKYFYNRYVKHSYFKNVYFRNMHFHYVRFENVTFEDVTFEWTKEWYTRAEFVNCRFINTMWVRPHFRHSYFHRSRFEGGLRYSDAELRYRDYFHTFVDFHFYDTIFCHVDWFDTFFYRGEAYNVTFNHNKWTRFELFETRFYSYYRMRVACRDIRYGDYVDDFRYFDDDHCYAYVYRYGADREFEFDDKFYDRDYYYSWEPSVKFYNCRFDFFKFRRHRFRAVEWFSTYFYNGTFYGEDRDYGYFHDMHFARCRFSYTDFYKHYFHGFMYFTGCYFDHFYFRETYADRFYFHGSHFYYYYMHFYSSRYMYFDHSFWEYGYIRGRYDFFRFEHALFRYFKWEADRVDKFEYCHTYFDNFKIADANIGSYKSICDAEHHRYKERFYRFCFDYPYYHQCMHYRPYWRFYYCHDEYHRCDWDTKTWWWRWDWHYPRHYYQSFFEFEKYDYSYEHHYDYYDKSFYGRYDFYRFDARHCYRRMDRFYDEPQLVMQEVDFYRPEGSFLGMDYNYRYYYDGLYKFDDFYYRYGRAFDKKYYWFERYFRCLHY